MEDVTVEDAANVRSEINTGIGIVIPWDKVHETLFQQDLIKEIAAMVKKG